MRTDRYAIPIMSSFFVWCDGNCHTETSDKSYRPAFLNCKGMRWGAGGLRTLSWVYHAVNWKGLER